MSGQRTRTVKRPTRTRLGQTQNTNVMNSPETERALLEIAMAESLLEQEMDARRTLSPRRSPTRRSASPTRSPTRRNGSMDEEERAFLDLAMAESLVAADENLVAESAQLERYASDRKILAEQRLEYERGMAADAARMASRTKTQVDLLKESRLREEYNAVVAEDMAEEAALARRSRSPQRTVIAASSGIRRSGARSGGSVTVLRDNLSPRGVKSGYTGVTRTLSPNRLRQSTRVITKSVSPKRMEESVRVIAKSLSPRQMGESITITKDTLIGKGKGRAQRVPPARSPSPVRASVRCIDSMDKSEYIQFLVTSPDGYDRHCRFSMSVHPLESFDNIRHAVEDEVREYNSKRHQRRFKDEKHVHLKIAYVGTRPFEHGHLMSPVASMVAPGGMYQLRMAMHS